MPFVRPVLAALAALLALVAFPAISRADSSGVTRATLSNGLQVIVVHNALAPVVTTMLTYHVGSDQQTIDGLAHATEHMMFRGSKTLSSSQLVDTIDVTGGAFNAETGNSTTQYYFTVPSQYLDIALRAERSRATGLLMAQDLWNNERGAITQEVTQDNSNALYRLFQKMEQRMLAGTPYAKNGLGTVDAFAHAINSPQLLAFYNAWYHPNNATYVIVGDVDGPATIAKVKELFGDIPPAKLPAREPVHLQPLQGTVYHDVSDDAYTAVLVGYRMPGYDSPDYAAGEILSDVLSSPRSDLGSLPFQGKALAAEFQMQPFAKTAIGIGFIALPVTSPPDSADRAIRAIIANYQKTGLPADLVAAAKKREIAQIEFGGTSIEGLASQWTQAVAVQGLHSPDDVIAQFDRVTVDDVDRVLRQYLDNKTAIAAYAVPKNSGASSSGGGQMAKENNSIPPSAHEALPSWAQHVLANLAVPENTLAPVDVTLPNGLRLIVEPEHITHSVLVSGQIRNNPSVQEPLGQDGISEVTTALFPFGTATYDRVAFQTELDKIAASTNAGTQFGTEVLASDFDRGIALLADEELHPAFDPKAFAIVQQQTSAALAGEVTSPDHLAAVAAAKALYPPNDPEQRFASTQSVGALTLDDVKAWYAAAYRPDLTTIVVTGDVTPELAQATIAKYFGAWAAAGPAPNTYPSPVPDNAPGQVSVPATGRVQSSVELIETLPLLRTDPDWAPLQVANTVLSGGFYSSLLYHDLREVHGYVYSVGSDITGGKVRGSFAVEYACDPKNIVPAQGQVQSILSGLQRDALEPDRLLRAKAMLMGDIPLSMASYDGVAGALLSYSVRGLPLDQAQIDARAELSATAGAIQAALAKYLRPAGFVRIVTGPGAP
jgi:zinc protease